jgi:hypothetical protein
MLTRRGVFLTVMMFRLSVVVIDGVLKTFWRQGPTTPAYFVQHFSESIITDNSSEFTSKSWTPGPTRTARCLTRRNGKRRGKGDDLNPIAAFESEFNDLLQTRAGVALRPTIINPQLLSA